MAVRQGRDRLGRSVADHVAAPCATFGPHVDHPVGRLDHVQVVLDHDHRVARLDEPTTGLHFEDTRKLLDVLTKLVEQGNTIVVIEHNLDVIKSADYVIDLGPEGGAGGGKIVAAGTPEEVARIAGSATGHFLSNLLFGADQPPLQSVAG